MSLEALLHRIAAESPDRGWAGPGAWWSEDARCWFLHVEDAPYYADPLGPGFTLYRAEDDGRVIGWQFFPECA